MQSQIVLLNLSIEAHREFQDELRIRDVRAHVWLTNEIDFAIEAVQGAPVGMRTALVVGTDNLPTSNIVRILEILGESSDQPLGLIAIGSPTGAEHAIRRLVARAVAMVQPQHIDRAVTASIGVLNPDSLGASQPAGQVEIGPWTALVVDDEELDRERQRHLILQTGGMQWRVLSAANGEEAINLASNEPIDLAFVDLQLPGMSGKQVIRELRLRCAHSSPTFIGVSGAGSEFAVRDLFQLGVADYITKSSLGAALIGRILLREQVSAPNAHPPGRDGLDPRAASDLLVICGSAGSQPLILEALASLEHDFAPSILLACHLNRVHPATGFMRLVSEACDIECRWLGQGDLLRPNTLLVAPPGHDVGVVGNRAMTQNATRFAAPVPSFNALLRTAADSFESNLRVVMFPGLGEDGLNGARRVRSRGGRLAIVRGPKSQEDKAMGCVTAAIQAAKLADDSLAAARTMANWLADSAP